MNRRFHWFTRVWAALAIALIAATWTLWTPQSGFPQIPFFEFLIHAPGWLDWVALTIVGLSLLICLLSKPPAAETTAESLDGRTGSRGPDWFRIGHLSFALAFALLISLDQNRLQPWAYHFVIISLLIGLASSKKASVLIRWIAISIYLYSAISKFDYQFVHTVGDQMLSTLCGFAGIETSEWSLNLKRGLVFLFPLGELLVGIGLAIPRLRAFAVLAAVGLHLALLLILGPWGLAHRPGVLLWNLFFLLQAVFLFWLSYQSNQDPPQHPNRLATLLTIFVLCFPMTQWIGICDHWPAWQVYSPSSSRAQLKNEVPVSQWCLDELGVPVYPQSRFQLAVAIAVVQKAAFTDPRASKPGLQIEMGHQSNRISGERSTEILTGTDQFKMKTSRFWLNTRARKLWFD